MKRNSNLIMIVGSIQQHFIYFNNMQDNFPIFIIRVQGSHGTERTRVQQIQDQSSIKAGVPNYLKYLHVVVSYVVRKRGYIQKVRLSMSLDFLRRRNQLIQRLVRNPPHHFLISPRHLKAKATSNIVVNPCTTGSGCPLKLKQWLTAELPANLGMPPNPNSANFLSNAYGSSMDPTLNMASSQSFLLPSGY